MMFGFLVRRAIDASARRTGSDPAWMHALHAASPAAFRKFAAVTRLAAHREAASAEAWYAAQLVGALAEDCGPCVQIVVDLARMHRIGDDQIEAVLRSDIAALSPDAALGYRFGQAVLARSLDADAIREQIRSRWGEKGVVDLTIALQAGRLFPMFKAGLGFARACERVRIGDRDVAVAHAA